MFKQRSGILVAGFALFSMFFGAGDLIWPMILGGTWGDKNFFAMLGLLITGVSLPLLGLIAMMLFEGDYRSFFERIGKGPALLLIFVIQAILGPVGSLPRLITLSYATVKPYFPFDISLLAFSVLACVVIFAFTLRPQKVVSLLGLILTPLLLLSLVTLLLVGFVNHPSPESIALSHKEAFSAGLSVGYNTLDLIASFIFAPFVLTYFIKEGSGDVKEARVTLFKKMVKASLIAAGLLSLMYVGLTYLSSYYTPLLPKDHLPEERLALISRHLLGSKGAVLSCIAVALTCLTTAIPLVTIFAQYLQQDLFRSQGSQILPVAITLIITGALANLGFMGIAKMLGPILQVLCPALIVLSVLNIVHKLYETRVFKTPVYAAFALSGITHFI